MRTRAATVGSQRLTALATARPNQSLIPDHALIFLIVIVGGGVQSRPLGTAAANRPILPTPGDYNDGEIGGMMIGRGNRSTRRKPAPMPLCPPQTVHAAPMRTRAAAVGSQRVTALATARPSKSLLYVILAHALTKRSIISDKTAR
jgi:hypothetical protein